MTMATTTIRIDIDTLPGHLDRSRPNMVAEAIETALREDGIKSGTHRPDGDIVEIQPVAVSGFQRLDEEVPGGNVEDQRVGSFSCGFGFGRVGHDWISDPG